MAVADASVIIALAKMKRLGLLRQLYAQLTMGPAVRREVVDQGKAISARGVEQVEEAMNEGWIQLSTLSAEGRKTMQRLLRNSRLHEGEAESISLAHSRKDLLIVDDKEARAVAAAMHLNYLGTAAVLLAGFLKNHVTMGELEEAIEELSSTIWLSPAVVAEVLRRAREAKK